MAFRCAAVLLQVLLLVAQRVQGADDTKARLRGVTLATRTHSPPQALPPWHPRVRKHEPGLHRVAPASLSRLASAFKGIDLSKLPRLWECTSCAACALGDASADAPPHRSERRGSAGSCALCVGCSHALELLPLLSSVALPLVDGDARQAAGAGGGAAARAFVKHKPGNTGATLLLAASPGGDDAVVKLHGVASPHVSAARLRTSDRTYKGRRYLDTELVRAAGLSALAASCGLERVAVREWVAPLRGVVPPTGEVVDEPYAVFADVAGGASLESLVLQLTPPQLLALLVGLSHDDVRDAAIHDLLFLQGDRHAENVFVGDGGRVLLIDSRDAALSSTGLDSVFFSSSAYSQVNRVGNEAAAGRGGGGAGVTHHLPLLSLDYRCHVPGGSIGHALPQKVRACADALNASTDERVAQEFFVVVPHPPPPLGAPSPPPPGAEALRLARLLRGQAGLLLAHGFEGAVARTPHRGLSRAPPGVPPPFPPFEPCCAARKTAGASYECARNSSGMPPRPARRSAAVVGTAGGTVPATPPPPDISRFIEPLGVAAKAANIEAWRSKVGDAVVDAGGADVFGTLPAAGFLPGFASPCWRNVSGTLRCLPSFHILGVSKCGTTDVYRRLASHPHVLPTRNKGPHFWDETHTFEWYLRLYDEASAAVEAAPGTAVFGDASSNTLTFSGVGVRSSRGPAARATLAAVLAAVTPTARLVAILRNPADRLYSSFYYYMHDAAKFGPTPDGFHAFALHQLAAYTAACEGLRGVAGGAAASRRACALKGYGAAEQLTKGIYAAFLPDYLAAFPREALLVVNADVYYSNTSTQLGAIVSHLRLAQPDAAAWHRMASGRRSNSRQAAGKGRGAGAGDMRDDTRALLNVFYAPHNTALAELLRDGAYNEWHAAGRAASGGG